MLLNQSGKVAMFEFYYLIIAKFESTEIIREYVYTVVLIIVRILEAVYEQDFIGDSYGFRPKRSCHQALRALSDTVENGPVNHIVEADIKGFFDNVKQDWLMKFLEHRIGDKRIQRMVKRFLNYQNKGVIYFHNLSSMLGIKGTQYSFPGDCHCDKNVTNNTEQYGIYGINGKLCNSIYPSI